MASPSTQGLLCLSSAIGTGSYDEAKNSESDDLSEEDEEEGGDGGSPPTQILGQGVDDSWKIKIRSNPRVDGSLGRGLFISVFELPELRLF